MSGRSGRRRDLATARRTPGGAGALAWRLDLALAGAHRLPRNYFLAEHLETAESFLKRFTAAGRMPADELREALEAGPHAALAWAAGDAPCPDRGKALA